MGETFCGAWGELTAEGVWLYVNSREGIPMRGFDGAMILGSWQWSFKGVATLDLGGWRGLRLERCSEKKVCSVGLLRLWTVTWG